MKSASSSQRISPILKAKEAAKQLRMLLHNRSPWRTPDFTHLDAIYHEYNALVTTYAGRGLKEARTFEVGSGQRPYRLLYLLASGVEAYGIDLDTVVDKLSPSIISQMYKKNGLERTIKTVVRYALFDRTENEHFRTFLAARQGSPFAWPRHRLIHGSASDALAWPNGNFDFILSEDVFEHIPVHELEKVCEVLANRLSQGGVAFIRPMIFTGIQGGHNVDWYDVSLGRQRECPPWDHLRAYRFPANTYLNQLSLADYRALFSRYFRILEERIKRPDLGREHMTPEIRAELAQYSDEELYSNHVGFVLTSKA